MRPSTSGLSRRRLDAMLNYYADFTTEIDEEIAESVAVAGAAQGVVAAAPGPSGGVELRPGRHYPTERDCGIGPDDSLTLLLLFCRCCVTGHAPARGVAHCASSQPLSAPGQFHCGTSGEVPTQPSRIHFAGLRPSLTAAARWCLLHRRRPYQTASNYRPQAVANWATPYERSCGDEGVDEKEDATFGS